MPGAEYLLHLPCAVGRACFAFIERRLLMCRAGSHREPDSFRRVRNAAGGGCRSPLRRGQWPRRSAIASKHSLSTLPHLRISCDLERCSFPIESRDRCRFTRGKCIQGLCQNPDTSPINHEQAIMERPSWGQPQFQRPVGAVLRNPTFSSWNKTRLSRMRVGK